MSAMASGLFTVSIDLASTGPADQKPGPAIVDFARRIASLLDRLAIEATLICDAAESGSLAQDLAGGRHEIALAGKGAWIGGKTIRADFHSELSRRLTAARGQGLEITTLAIRSAAAALESRTDLLLKSGITAIAINDSAQVAIRAPRPLRFGLWEIPVADQLPGKHRYAWTASRRMRRRIDQAIASRQVYHLSIEVNQLSAWGGAGLGAVEKILTHVDRRRVQGVLQVATLSAVGPVVRGDRRADKARSILSPAA